MMEKSGLLFSLRKHWKKSIFASGLFLFGLNYTTQRYREHLVRRGYLLEAQKFGEEKCHPLEKPRRIYVILNPHAGNSKCKKLFMKNAAPILFLSGIDVTYIQTNYEGHSKTLVNYFDRDINGLVVAGGNGSLQEVVTGLMRQKDNDEIRQIPLGIIPLGYRSNSLFKRLFHDDVVNVKAMCKAAMAVVKATTKDVDVLEIKTEKKSVYAMSTIHIGVQQQVKENIDIGRFWLLGPFKQYFAFVWRTVKNWPPSFNILYSLGGEQQAKGSTETTDGLSLYLEDDSESQQASILVETLKKEYSRESFINFGWQWIKQSFHPVNNEIFNQIKCDEVQINPPADKEISYDIDGEIFDPRPIQISICPTKIKMFYNEET